MATVGIPPATSRVTPPTSAHGARAHHLTAHSTSSSTWQWEADGLETQLQAHHSPSSSPLTGSVSQPFEATKSCFPQSLQGALLHTFLAQLDDAHDTRSFAWHYVLTVFPVQVIACKLLQLLQQRRTSHERCSCIAASDTAAGTNVPVQDAASR